MNTFHFKQFSLVQQQAGMRLSSDAVLFGAWAGEENPQTLLDVGSGTGVLSLMLAQRFPVTKIYAIEIEEGACKDAALNFRNAPWSNRLHLIEDDFLAHRFQESFDLIVSNPPFFDAEKSKISPASRRNLARIDNALPLTKLVKKAAELLTAQGKFSLILPASREWDMRSSSAENGLFITRMAEVSPFPNVAANRIFITLSKENTPTTTEKITLYNTPGVWSDKAKQLTAAFYLDPSNS